MDEEEVKFVYTIHITCLLELQTKVREDFIITGMALNRVCSVILFKVK